MLKCGESPKGPEFQRSYPHFKTFGTELATLLHIYKDSNYSKIYNEEFCWFRVLLG